MKRCAACKIEKPVGEFKPSKQVVFVIGTKSGKVCADCEGVYPYYVLDYDHREPAEKFRGINSMVRTSASIPEIASEIAKCDLVCANCHRIRTHNRRKAGSLTRLK